MLKRLVKVMPADKFKNISNGIFTSKLIYCLQLFGNVWGLPSLDENVRRFSSFTKDDNRKLQVIQNKVLRLQSGLPQDTPLTLLLEATNEMSVMQLTAYHTLMTVHRTISTGQPEYLARKLKVRTEGRHKNTVLIPNVNLTISRGGFFYRGATLWNMLPENMRDGMKTPTFRTALRRWIRANIGIRPP